MNKSICNSIQIHVRRSESNNNNNNKGHKLISERNKKKHKKQTWPKKVQLIPCISPENRQFWSSLVFGGLLLATLKS